MRTSPERLQQPGLGNAFEDCLNLHRGCQTSRAPVLVHVLQKDWTVVQGKGRGWHGGGVMAEGENCAE